MDVGKAPDDLAATYRSLPRENRTGLVRLFLLRGVERNPSNVVSLTARTFGLSRQAVTRQVETLVTSGLLEVSGVKRGRVYKLREIARHREFFEVSPNLHEDEVWTQHFADHIADLPDSVKRICYYGFTEMLNNVIDHSESSRVSLILTRNAIRLEIDFHDYGVGIFNKIRQAGKLETPRIAVFELTKGKFTTDPARHTGEGIFFTSRMFDSFAILSGDFYLSHDRGKEDWLLESRRDRPLGTSVFLQIDPHTTHTVEEVLTHYATEQDDYAFNRTKIAIKLAIAEGEQLVSRSQSKRISARLEKFKEVILDFQGIGTIGPGFADELFRVFRTHHPHVTLIPINTNEEVTRMIRRAEDSGGFDNSDIRSNGQ